MVIEIPNEIDSFLSVLGKAKSVRLFLLKILRNSDDQVFDWKFAYCNEGAAESLNLSLHQVIGRTFREINPGVLERKPDLLNFISSLAEKGSEWKGTLPSSASGKPYDCTLFSPLDDWVVSITQDMSSEVKQKDIYRQAALISTESIYYFEPFYNSKKEILDFTLSEVNPAGELELAQSKENIIGKGLCELFHIDPKSESFNDYKNVFINGRPFQKEYTVQNDNSLSGTYFQHVTSLPEGILIANRNVTELRKVEQEIRDQKEQLEQTYQASNDGYWNYDIKSRKLFLSSRWKNMLGFEDHEISNDLRSWLRLVHPEDSHIIASSISKGKLEKIVRFNEILRFKKKDGSYVYIQSKAIVLRSENGEPIRMVGTHTDITSIKETENALALAKEKAEAADRAKSEFLGMISHEMRTPLHGISGMANLLQQTSLDSSQREFLKDLVSSTDILTQLIDDLLEVITLENPKIKIREETVDLSAMLTHLSGLILPKTAAKGLQFNLKTEANVPTSIRGDRFRIEQILLNFITNSIKFTEVGSIDLLLALEEESIVFKVMDTGIGISKEAHERIFEAFHQEDLAYARKHKGVGLGLYICKKLAEKMGGAINLDSKQNQGSEFTLKLPLRISDQPTIVETKTSTKEIPKLPFLKALVVDDNDINCKILSKLIEKTGAKTVLSDSGEDAVFQFKADPKSFNVIFLDLQMPGMDGYQTADAIRAAGKFGWDVTIIAVTASSFSETYKACAEHGITGFLGKPYNSEQLYSILEKFL
ncbi:PAS domain S-box protein [Leptospira broomii serovar Hurstbridge str. 5399]|uniref:histidine kinase n=1 Tax=Leptospira broomii serovar Hurstbridge str. 5399 TaxID=1049789 RepID=T0FAV7_9LEPT|nr:hybrid sensor histidine kinase/response regulator [Leptospira broomii]EQA44687.1 PAS domain S-box protein [Leptospira broomii serovar Hurstbridge str. 5399]